MDTNTEIAWGLPVSPDSTVLATWGARAIYERSRNAHKLNYTKAGTLRKRGLVPWYNVDLLWDRQSGTGATEARLKLNAWVNKVGMPKLRAEICIHSDEEEVWTFTDGPFTLSASPRASYGYLYITATIAKGA